MAARLADAGHRVLLPEWRGTGGDPVPVRRRRSATRPLPRSRADVLDLVDALGVDRFAVVGHDWGARVAYALAALVPERLSSIAGLALAYQPRGEFVFPSWAQAQNFWYQWLMYVDAGARGRAGRPGRLRPSAVGDLEPAGLVGRGRAARRPPRSRSGTRTGRPPR